ncbi:hypothetical protein IRJ41_012474 [Triplophysa rosa]|uniref:Uncharacterized protein n=1 Tax=Triplophysa rosa TaxID=992332 RepID=A0A9W8C2B9_TRIRA|nr:hypothetical protein IRJ41_012474 [Triplophysa rosa]
MRSLQEESVVLTGFRLLGEETTVPQENMNRSPSVPFDSLSELNGRKLQEGVLLVTRKSDGEKISQMQDSHLSERLSDVMNPSTVTLDSKRWVT